MSKQTFHLPTWRRKPTADEAAPLRRGQRSKSQVHALTFTENFMRPAAAGLSALLAEGKIGRK